MINFYNFKSKENTAEIKLKEKVLKATKFYVLILIWRFNKKKEISGYRSKNMKKKEITIEEARWKNYKFRKGRIYIWEEIVKIWHIPFKGWGKEILSVNTTAINLSHQKKKVLKERKPLKSVVLNMFTILQHILTIDHQWMSTHLLINNNLLYIQ